MCSKTISHPSPGHRQLWLGPPWQHSCHRDAFGHAAANLTGERECVKMLLQPGLLNRRLKDIVTKTKHCQKALNASPGGQACRAPPILGDLLDGFAGRQPQTWDCLGLHAQFEKIVWPTALQYASQTLVECKIPCKVMCSSAAHSYNKFGSSAVGFQIY